MIRIVAPHFVAGVVLDQGVVVRAAPIVNYMKGWDILRVMSYARGKGWQATYTP